MARCRDVVSLYEISDVLYNSATGTWKYTGSMNAARNDFTATLLNNGQVLAVGGYYNDPFEGAIALASAELFNQRRSDHFYGLLPHDTCHTQLITKQVTLLPSQYDIASGTLRADKAMRKQTAPLIQQQVRLILAGKEMQNLL